MLNSALVRPSGALSIHELETAELEQPGLDEIPEMDPVSHSELKFEFRPPRPGQIRRPRLWRINPRVCGLQS